MALPHIGKVFGIAHVVKCLPSSELSSPNPEVSFCWPPPPKGPVTQLPRHMIKMVPLLLKVAASRSLSKKHVKTKTLPDEPLPDTKLASCFLTVSQKLVCARTLCWREDPK